MPPIAPGPGAGLGTMTSEIWVGLGALVAEGPRFTISIWPAVGAGGLVLVTGAPDSSTKAWLVAGSTARPPQRVRHAEVLKTPVALGMGSVWSGQGNAMGPNAPRREESWGGRW